jgi:hypothetical protein
VRPAGKTSIRTAVSETATLRAARSAQKLSTPRIGRRREKIAMPTAVI